MALFALTFVLIARQLDERQDVLVLARDVPRGQVIADSDLRTARVGAERGVPTLFGSERTKVVGKTALRSLIAGQLLQRGDIDERGQYPPQGKAEVSISLKPGAVPPSVREGQRAAVLDSPSAGASGSTAGPSNPVIGDVVRVDVVRDAGETIVVTLLIDTAALPFVAALREPRLAVLAPGDGGVP